MVHELPTSRTLVCHLATWASSTTDKLGLHKWYERGGERKWDNLEADLWELRCPERFRKNPGKVREKFRKLFQSRIFFFEENKREPKIEASTKKGEVCFWHLGEMAPRLFFWQHFPEWPWHYGHSSHSLSERARFEPCTAKTGFFSFLSPLGRNQDP